MKVIGMEIKYAVRTISPSPHSGPCYLQESEYGLQFTYRASEPRGTPGQILFHGATELGITDLRIYGDTE